MQKSESILTNKDRKSNFVDKVFIHANKENIRAFVEDRVIFVSKAKLV